MIIFKGPHYKIELELLIEDVRELAYGEPADYSTINFLNAKIQREFVHPFNESFYPYIGADAITRCKYEIDNSWTGRGVKLKVDVHNFFMNRLNEEDLPKTWPFSYNE